MRALRSVLIVLIVLLPARPFATTFPVTKTTDTDDGVCDADCSLREAIDAANTNPGADDVPVPAGFYLLRLGQLVVSDDVSIAGAEQTSTIIDGNAADRVIDIEANSGVVAISGVTIQNGYSDSGGGGIFNDGDLTLTNSTVSGNTVYGDGGGIDSYGDLTLNNSTVSGNTAYATVFGGGGGISSGGYVTLTDSTVSGNWSSLSGGGIDSWGYVTLTNSAVSGNTARLDGGGIEFGNFVPLTLTNSTVSGNISVFGSGGGISIWLGYVTLTNSTVSNNTAGEDGGGIYNGLDLTLTNSTVSNNTAYEDGGGIYNDGVLTLTNSTVSNNTAGSGGGISNRFDFTLTNSTVSNNTAGEYGGGIDNWNYMTLTNSTVSDNAAGSGGGIYNFSYRVLDVINTIVAGNLPYNCNEEVDSSGYNLADDTSCAFTAPGDLVVADAMLYPLGDFGGPTKTHHPMTDSPVIDMADDAGCPATDQRGEARPFDGDGNGVAHCDIGSVEYLPEPGSWPMLAAGALFLGALSRRRA